MASPPWESLHPDMLGRIFRSLPSLNDRVYTSAVCRHWRSVAVQRENQPELPWLLMPYPASASHFRVFGGTTHQENPEHVPSGARFCGSFPGGWFVVQLRARRGRYALLNLPSGKQIALPDNMEAPVRSDSGTQHYSTYPVVDIHAAVLSAAPTPGGAYIVAAITSGQTNIAFWRPGMAHWSPPLHTEVDRRVSWPEDMIPTVDGSMEMEDILHYRRSDFECFCVLTSTELVYSYEPVITADGMLTMSRSGIRIDTQRAARAEEPVARYLVLSGENLLIVRRFASSPVAPDVIGLHAIRITREGEEEGYLRQRNCWGLPGQVLFLGRGCSRAYTTAVHTNPGGYIYFLDADRFPGSMTIGYHCSDTGRCDYRHFLLQIQRVLPQGPESDCSPWIWFFH